jgi:arginyl-tRNA--protein-N-Asp/Glu arginylyltransferase
MRLIQITFNDSCHNPLIFVKTCDILNDGITNSSFYRSIDPYTSNVTIASFCSIRIKASIS